MLKKTIKYTDFDGVEREEDFYFNFTKAELTKMDLTTSGGMEKFVNKMIGAKDIASLTNLFTDIILKSYGEKSDDGKHFRKSKEISDDFANSEAFSVLFMELLQNENTVKEFITGILPADLKAAVEKELNKTTPAITTEAK